MTSWQTQILVKGLGVGIGECILGLNGPFLFQRFGLSSPTAALVGTVLGAAAGYYIAKGWMQMRNRDNMVSPVSEIAKPEIGTGLDDLRLAGISGSIDTDPERERVERALAAFTKRDAGNIRIEVRNGKVVLRGKVHSWADEAEAERIAFDVPGIQEVDNRLQVVP